MHILNFQRDLVVGWIIHIELKVPLLSRVLLNYIYIYILILNYIYISILILNYMCVCVYIYISILILYLEEVLLAQYV